MRHETEVRYFIIWKQEEFHLLHLIVNILSVIINVKFLYTQKKESCIHLITASNHSHLYCYIWDNQHPVAAYRPLRFCEIEGMSGNVLV